MNIWDIIGLFFWSFVLVAYLMVLFSIVADLFRDHRMHGFVKAVWIVFLIFVPFVTALVYLIARGRGMNERSVERADQSRLAANAYIRSAAGGSAAADIAKGKTLLDEGVINAAEFESLKAQALDTSLAVSIEPVGVRA